MSEIDFLDNKKEAQNQKPKNKADKKAEIIWSEPDENNPLLKEAPFTLLSFFSKKKEAKKSASASSPAINENKIRNSRREILKLIKYNKSKQPAIKKKSGLGFIAGLMERFKKQPSHKEVLINYQQVINQEKTKRNSGTDRPSAVEFSSSARSADPRYADPRSGEARALSRQAGRAQTAPAAEPRLASRRLEPLASSTLGSGQVKAPRSAEPVPAAEKPAGKENQEIKTKDKGLARIKSTEVKPDHTKVLETNLIKGEIITFFDWRKKIITLINAVIIPVFLIAVIYLGLLYYQKQSQAKIQEQVKKFDNLSEQIRREEIGLKEIIDFQARFKIVSQIFAKHIYWTNFFKFLEDNTIKNVYYNGFRGDTGGEYSLDSIGSKFSNISEQVNILRNNQMIIDARAVSGESISSDSVDKSGVKFNLDFSILKSIFTD